MAIFGKRQEQQDIVSALVVKKFMRMVGSHMAGSNIKQKLIGVKNKCSFYTLSGLELAVLLVSSL